MHLASLIDEEFSHAIFAACEQSQMASVLSHGILASISIHPSPEPLLSHVIFFSFHRHAMPIGYL